MKRLKRSIALAMCLSVALLNATAQQTTKSDSTKKQLGLIAKIDILWPVLSITASNITTPTLSASVEKFISRHASLQLTGFYSFLKNTIPENSSQNMSMYIIAPEAKYYFSKAKKHSGFYAGAFASFLHESDATNSIPSNTYPYPVYQKNLDVIVTAGAIVGVQYYITKRLETDFLIGMGEGYDYSSFSASKDISPENTVRYSHYPQGIANLNIGYMF